MYLTQLQNGFLSLSKNRKGKKKITENDAVTDHDSSHDHTEDISTETSLNDETNSSSHYKSSSPASCITPTIDRRNSPPQPSIQHQGDVRVSETYNNNNIIKKKKVSFDDKRIQWIDVESYMLYSADIWWSKDEVKQRQLDLHRIFFEYQPNEFDNIFRYSRAYCNARNQSIVSKEQLTENENGGTKSMVSISNEDYRSIVQGKAAGYDGLEKCLALSSSDDVVDDMTARRKKIIKTIVTSFRTMCLNRSKDNDDDMLLIHRKLRSIAKSLTSCDRSWAVIMGRSDHDAALLS